MRGARPRRRKHAPARSPEVDIGALTCLIGYMLRRAQIAVFQDVFRAFATVGIRPAQFSVLTVIARNPGRTQSQVAAALGIKRTNFVALIDSPSGAALPSGGRRRVTGVPTPSISPAPAARPCGGSTGWSTSSRPA